MPLKGIHADYVYSTLATTTAASNKQQISAVSGQVKTVISEIWSIEILLIFIFIILAIQIGLKMYEKRFVQINYHTILRLDLKSSNQKFSKIILKLQQPTSYYRMDIIPNQFAVTYRNFLMIFNWKPSVIITKKLTSTTEQFDGYFYLKPWEKNKVEAILSSAYFTTVITILDFRYRVQNHLLLHVGLNQSYRDLPGISGAIPMMPFSSLAASAYMMSRQSLYPLRSLKEEGHI